MHVYFSGIGGTGIGPLALIAKKAGFDVSGSDSNDSDYIAYLRSKGIETITIGQDGSQIKNANDRKKIEWLIRSSAVPDDNPEVVFAHEQNIPVSKRDEFINELLRTANQNMIAVAGTHGKTTTTSMIVWLFKQLDIPVSYSVGGKLSFGDMGEFDQEAEYFVYEADEYDRNFLSFNPTLAVISGVAYDHPDIYPTGKEYTEAFLQFINQSNDVLAHPEDMRRITSIDGSGAEDELDVLGRITLPGDVNRKNAQLAIETMYRLGLSNDVDKLVECMNAYPGVSRRFEKLAENVYTDYAHTPEKIAGALQMAQEVNGLDYVVVYEGLHNTRQHFIKDELKHLFSGVKKLYVVPSYRAREDESLEDLTPEKLVGLFEEPSERETAELSESLKQTIKTHADNGDLVLCLTAGGAGSLDEWLRKEFSRK